MAKRKTKPANATTKQKKQHPDWSALNPREVESMAVELAKAGKSTSEIGIILRDQYAVPDIRVATGRKLTKLLEENGIKQEIPEDLRNLINRASQLKKHLDEHKKDFKNKRGLQVLESKIRSLEKYYGSQGRLPKGWKYTTEQAKLMSE
ncbi:MAG: 30S ribosomal protein S15 [Candidatus Thermoplasmatota archaeon]|jgi:small subunit ribosomal protein S15|nr:30S ribosomal protein S15 [Candidatus Thermoplasmatota archaeon]